MQVKVLVIEDEQMLLDLLTEALSSDGFEVGHANSVSNGLIELQNSSPNIIVCDYQLPDGTCFDVLNWLHHRDLSIPLIVVTGHASIDLAVRAVKSGAEQFIPKPIDLGFLKTLLRRTIENRRNQKKVVVASRLEQSRFEADPFLGVSRAIQQLQRAAERLQESDSTILIQGETGTGKGVLARWIYGRGKRASESFVDLNCAGLSHELLESELFGHQRGAFTGAVANKMGFIEAANHGTLFLDEIGDMDLAVQAKMLKIVEEKRFFRLGDVLERNVDVQIIAATHRDLKQMVDQDKFRSDFYYRISSLRLRIPALRERPEDIPVIVDRLLERIGSRLNRRMLRISDRARATLQNYGWPGNIRELQNVLERAALLADGNCIEHTSLEFEHAAAHESSFNPSMLPSVLTLEEVERLHIERTLQLEGGSVLRAARRLGIPRSSLYAKIRGYSH